MVEVGGGREKLFSLSWSLSPYYPPIHDGDGDDDDHDGDDGDGGSGDNYPRTIPPFMMVMVMMMMYYDHDSHDDLNVCDI